MAKVTLLAVALVAGLAVANAQFRCNQGCVTAKGSSACSWVEGQETVQPNLTETASIMRSCTRVRTWAQASANDKKVYTDVYGGSPLVCKPTISPPPPSTVSPPPPPASGFPKSEIEINYCCESEKCNSLGAGAYLTRPTFVALILAALVAFLMA